jgi:hypothetical protein
MTVGMREALSDRKRRPRDAGRGEEDYREHSKSQEHRASGTATTKKGTTRSLRRHPVLRRVRFDRKLDDKIDPKLLREINRRVFGYNESYSLAEHRLSQWAKKEWPDWNEERRRAA